MGKIKTGIKMKVNPKQSIKVQEICFENDVDIEWASGTYIKHIDKPFLYINDSHLLGYGEEFHLFSVDKNEEVSAELFIRTNGTCVESETLTEDTPSEEPQPKTLSEYLKENNAYEAFIENCVEDFLNDINVYNEIKRDSKEGSIISLEGAFSWKNTKQGFKHWSDLYYNKPENFVYDMDEIIFAEVDKRIAEQNTSTKYMVFVEGRSNPKKVHDSYDSAEKEAKRLSAKEIGCNIMILSVVKTFKSKVIVEEVQ